MRRVWFLLASLLMFALAAGEVLAATTFFDHFTDPGGAGWSWSPGEGRNHVVFAHGGTHLYLYDDSTGTRFPLVGRNDAFGGINGYWRLSLRFRFPSVTAYGTNLAAGTAAFDADSRQPQSEPPRADWQDVLLVHQFTGAFYIHAFGTEHYRSNDANDTGRHTVELEVGAGSYVLRLDGAQIGAGSAGGVTPRSLWFGNYFIQDWPGNFTDVQVDWVNVETDLEPPVTRHVVLSGTAGNDGWYRSAVQIGLSASDAWSGVATTGYRIDGGSWQAYGGPFTVSGDGTHTVEYRSTDNAGNVEATQTLTVRIDTVPPSTTASADCSTPGNGGWCRGPVDVTFSASDAGSGVDATQYRIDGGSWQAYFGPFIISTDGDHTVEFYSVDVAGNQETAGSVQVLIDATPPATTATPSGTAGENGWWRSAV
ncbi:MAG TPA: hypothetical protein ENI39_04775, partial [Anaerolineae bacterium]|nr:hypothetical protein [Anaerolineae bacterium]